MPCLQWAAGEKCAISPAGLVLCKWLAMQAAADDAGAVEAATRLLSHPDFDLSNPNKVWGRHATATQPPLTRPLSRHHAIHLAQPPRARARARATSAASLAPSRTRPASKPAADHHHRRVASQVGALVGSLARNLAAFHRADGGGYAFVGDRVAELHSKNPQLAAALAKKFAGWRQLVPSRQALMKAQLQRITAIPNVSKDVYEVATLSLAA